MEQENVLVANMNILGIFPVHSWQLELMVKLFIVIVIVVVLHLHPPLPLQKVACAQVAKVENMIVHPTNMQQPQRQVPDNPIIIILGLDVLIVILLQTITTIHALLAWGQGGYENVL